MNIAVIGHFCLDVIHHPDGRTSESYGGIFFSVAALANFLGKNDMVLPVFGVGKTEYESVIERLNVYPNVDSSSIFKINGPTNQVDLFYSTKEKRVECSKHISDPIPIKKIRSYLPADLVLINMISGFDITLDTLDAIRVDVREDRTPIYLDVHCLPCGVNEDFTRYYRPVDTWRRWLFMLHAVQMNEQEAASLTTENFDEATLARHVLALNTKVMHVTKGERGSTVYIDEHKQIKQVNVAGIETEKAIDTTGCGDVFAAAYSAYYMKTKDVIASTNFANRAASFNAQLTGSHEIDKLLNLRISEQ